MTKSVKHKRERKKDVKKYALKSGRKLLRAQNESKTDFKSRKILIKEQLSEKTNESSLITKKQLDIKELLSRLAHSSVHARQDGIDGIKELLNNNAINIIAPHVAHLIQGLVPLITDDDHNVRKGTVKILEIIIVKTGSLIQPYFHLLTSRLSLAMVHLNSGIQSDSLQLMDVLLSHTPSLIAQSCNVILKKYLSLISRKMDNNGSQKKIISFTLHSDPTSLLATQSWRVKLLRNLSKYIGAILREKDKLEESIPNNMWLLIEKGSFPPLMRMTEGRASTNEIKILSEESEAQTFIMTLIPLLFEIWAEMLSSKGSTKGNPLNVPAIEILSSIVQIILHLWQITEIVTNENPLKCIWFKSLIATKLEKRILEGFPYSSLEVTKRKGMKKEVDGNRECEKVNVLIANLSFRYLQDTKKINKLVLFYCEILEEYSPSKPFQMEDVISVVTALFDDERRIPHTSKEKLLNSSLKCFQTNTKIVALLQIPLASCNRNSSNFLKTKHSPSLEKWMNFLIDTSLTLENPESILEVLQQFRLRKTPGFAAAMGRRRHEFRDKMSGRTSDNLVNCGIEILV